jgi:hypothetical protein
MIWEVIWAALSVAGFGVAAISFVVISAHP